MRKHGYETVYLQGSGLAFMAKDMFMPMAGFDLVLGRESIPKYYAINTWGVDDRSLFEATLARIDSLQESSKPWFLTVLTVGTHHPGIVPSSFSAGPYPGFFERSVAYLDLALGDLFAGLKQRRIFEDTLVVVTSDETQVTEQDKREEKFRQVLRQAWGLLAMWGPGIEPAVVAEPGAQIDVPLTIMDYLGLEVPGGSIGGRSLLRTYATARDLPFGNAYAKSVAIFNAGNGLTFCNEAFSECKSLKRAEGSMFEGTYTEEAELDAEAVSDLRARAAASRFVGTRPEGRRSIRIFNKSLIPLGETLGDNPGGMMVAGGQLVTIPARSRVVVDVRLRAEGGGFSVNHRLNVSNRSPLYLRRPGPLSAGEEVRFDYALSTEERIETASFNFYAGRVRGESPRLRVVYAQVEIRELEDDSAASGIEYDRTRIVR
jgi:hypothetical protein